MRLTRTGPPRPDRPAKVLQVRPPQLPVSSPVEEDFERLYVMAVPRARAYAMWYLAEQPAMDAIHDAAAELFAKWEQMPLEQKTVAWFLRAVYFRIIDTMREQAVEDDTFVDMAADDEGVLYPDPSPSPMAVMERRSEWEYLMRFVDTLPSGVRTVWLLSHEQQLTPSEIAEMRGTSPVTVRRQLAEAAAALGRYRERAEKRLARDRRQSLLAASYDTEVRDD